MSLITALLVSMLATAQVGLKVDNVDTEADETTITVKKGASTKPNEIRFEITEGHDEIEGDPAPLQKDARANWKKACNEWRQEFKEMNKENQIISLNCGKTQCATTAMETVCKSDGKYKMKVRMN